VLRAAAPLQEEAGGGHAHHPRQRACGVADAPAARWDQGKGSGMEPGNGMRQAAPVCYAHFSYVRFKALV
jgi:hypothetical protein